MISKNSIILKYLLYITLFAVSFLSCFAQDKEVLPVEPIDGILAEFLDQITIEKGEKMDTVAIRNLFHPSARFTVASDSSAAESVSLVEFLTLLKDPYYENGYLEEEIRKHIDEYNGIAQVFQSFYGKDYEVDEEKGINSY